MRRADGSDWHRIVVRQHDDRRRRTRTRRGFPRRLLHRMTYVDLGAASDRCNGRGRRRHPGRRCGKPMDRRRRRLQGACIRSTGSREDIAASWKCIWPRARATSRTNSAESLPHVFTTSYSDGSLPIRDRYLRSLRQLIGFLTRHVTRFDRKKRRPEDGARRFVIWNFCGSKPPNRYSTNNNRKVRESARAASDELGEKRPVKPATTPTTLPINVCTRSAIGTRIPNLLRNGVLRNSCSIRQPTLALFDAAQHRHARRQR